ncbi:hypothetical protein RJT34_32100 [Clitoria ternatea]|uniref:Ubiquitin-like protease family profile domain-containing protein n=1 Tax=Clitoria ternatea TaxID=43366 RepID=A0AAN9I932_CLITE
MLLDKIEVVVAVYIFGANKDGISHRRSPSSLMEFYQNSHMGQVETLNKIFVPINKSNMHWFLLVIDLKEEQIYFVFCNCSNGFQ